MNKYLNPHFLTAICIGSALTLFSCGQGAPKSADAEKSADSTAAPVETKKANTDYQPAFAGQTRIAGVKTATPYEYKMLDSTLKFPWGVTSLPDGRLIITERKAGTMRIVTLEGKVGEAITGIPAVNPEGQGGLLGIRVDPDFGNNRMIYWVFS